jgi:hypothetical protein
MTPSTDTTHRPPSRGRVPLRLQLNTKLGQGPLDGSWWPQSRDLSIELADLVDHFPGEHGQVTRAVFSRPDWDTAPHRVRVSRGLIKVGSYPHDDTHQIWLTMSSRRAIGLSVEPSAPVLGGAESSQPPRWAVDQAAVERHDATEGSPLDARARQLVRASQAQPDEHHDEFADPDLGGEG